MAAMNQFKKKPDHFLSIREYRHVSSIDPHVNLVNLYADCSAGILISFAT
jgi:hypothetical protein